MLSLSIERLGETCKNHWAPAIGIAQPVVVERRIEKQHVRSGFVR